MKKLLLVAVFASLCSGMLFAQNVKSEKAKYKERKEILKYSAKQLEEKASKEARKEAKRLAKEGWKAMPGALPLDKQLDRSYKMQNEYGEDLYPKYIMGEASSIGQNYDAAKISALSIAQQNLAGSIQQEVTALIENTLANTQIDAGETVSLTKTVMASKNLISQSLGRTIPVLEAYRDVSSNQKEVLVRIAYSGDQAKKKVREIVRAELEKEGKDLHKTLDDALWGTK